MRRKDRELTDVQDILSIIEKCDSCNLGLSQNNMPYVVPINFGYTFENDKLTMYFHGARDGKKLDIIAQNPNACFSLDRAHQLVTNENAAQYSMLYESVMGFGKIQVLQNVDEKRVGLAAVMRKYAPDREFQFPDEMLNHVCVMRLDVEELTGKRNKG